MHKQAYPIPVEHPIDPYGTKDVQKSTDVEDGNRDTVAGLAEHLKQREDPGRENAEAFAVGLKLFSSVLLEQKDLPLFETILPQFTHFLKELKKYPA